MAAGAGRWLKAAREDLGKGRDHELAESFRTSCVALSPAAVAGLPCLAGQVNSQHFSATMVKSFLPTASLLPRDMKLF